VPHSDCAPLEDLAAGIRRLVDLLLRAADDDPALPCITAELDRISAELERKFEPGEPFEKMLRSDRPRHDPIAGIENALAPPLRIDVAADGTVISVAEFALPYQGPRGVVHGGISALVLDHMLSMANGGSRGSLVTAELSVRFHRPLPLFTACEIRCRQTEVDGRKVRAYGEIVVGGAVAVTATGLFIAKRISPDVPAVS
jgi:acyl-coenzyme A thioesterase PaaI-like protein